jgi:hypothetical protein
LFAYMAMDDASPVRQSLILYLPILSFISF